MGYVACYALSVKNATQHNQGCDDATDEGRMSEGAEASANVSVEAFVSAPAKLGLPIRLFEVYFVLIILGWLGFAVPTEGGEFTLNLNALFVLEQIVCYALCVWLIERRSVYARPLVIGSMVVLIILSLFTIVPTFFTRLEAAGRSPAAVLSTFIALAIPSYGIPLGAILYFAFSKQAKAALSNHPTRSEQERNYAAHTNIPNFKTWAFWRDLAIYYCIFSIVGHWAELLFCELIRLGVVMGEYDTSNAMLFEQWLYPFPAEGIAVVLIILILFPLKEAILRKMGGRTAPTLVLSFLANALVCTSIDFFTGITANADYHLWDYREMPFNFMGQICLQNSIVYSVAATIIVWLVYPAIESLMRRIPNYAQNAVFVGFGALYLFLELIYVVNVGDAGLIFG